MLKLKSQNERMNPPEKKTNRHKPKESSKRGFSTHVHQSLRGPIRVHGIKPERGEWYMCSCGTLLLQVTVCEITQKEIDRPDRKPPMRAASLKPQRNS